MLWVASRLDEDLLDGALPVELLEPDRPPVVKVLLQDEDAVARAFPGPRAGLAWLPVPLRAVARPDQLDLRAARGHKLLRRK